MKNKYVNLLELVKLINNKELSEQYCFYLCNRSNSYNHVEILSLNIFINFLKREISNSFFDNFLYGYSIPHISKEFDLLKITASYVLNIELKSEKVSEEKIKEQLKGNAHYLKLLSKNKSLVLITFISSSKTFYKLDNDVISLINVQEINELFSKINLDLIEFPDLDLEFSSSSLIISPINDIKKFIYGDYLLTNPQEGVKRRIFKENPRFIELSGDAGTGKTLLLFDIAKELSKTMRILFIHCGNLSNGFLELEKKLDNIDIISAKAATYRKKIKWNYIIIDEAQRIYPSLLKKIILWANENDLFVIFSLDKKQIMSKEEAKNSVWKEIEKIDGIVKLSLGNKIRSNENIISFIDNLFNREKKKFDGSYIKIIYEPNDDEADEIAKKLENDGYTYIQFTPSLYVYSEFDNKSALHNTHSIIGQDADGVVMILNNYFYFENEIIHAKQHPCPNYLLTNMLYQGLTRAKDKIALIIEDELLLKNVLSLFKYAI